MSSVEAGERAKLQVREMVFATLVAEEGYCYTDAYKEAYQPETTLVESIQQMASRIANRPRVKAEIARIKNRLAEEEMSKEQRLAIVLNGAAVRDRMALELYAIATSEEDAKTRMKAWEMIGNLEHVDAFVGNKKVDQRDQSTPLNLGTMSSAGEARQALKDWIIKRTMRQLNSAPIDIAPIQNEPFIEVRHIPAE